MPAFRPLLLGATCLAILLGSGSLLAAADNGKKNQANGQNGKPSSSQMSDSPSQKGNKASQSSKNKGNQGGDADDDDFQHRYADEEDDIRRIFERNSGHYGQVEALPPGIRKNLARGKPLPPGIAKKLDPSFARQLPYYQGYEWQQVGTDAALVNITTGVVREVLNDVLR